MTDELFADTVSPRQDEIEIIECILIKEIENQNAKFADTDRINDLPAFGRQYCALINSNGDRFIYLNAYKVSRKGGALPESWVIFEDGGPSRFEALFDLYQMQIVHLMVNGWA